MTETEAELAPEPSVRIERATVPRVGDSDESATVKAGSARFGVVKEKTRLVAVSPFSPVATTRR